MTQQARAPTLGPRRLVGRCPLAHVLSGAIRHRCEPNHLPGACSTAAPSQTTDGRDVAQDKGMAQRAASVAMPGQSSRSSQAISSNPVYPTTPRSIAATASRAVWLIGESGTACAT